MYYKKWLQHEGWKPNYVYLKDQYKINHVNLLDKERKVIASGQGKGEEYKIGALAESIEHYYGSQENEDHYFFQKATQVAGQDFAKRCKLLLSLAHS